MEPQRSPFIVTVKVGMVANSLRKLTRFKDNKYKTLSLQPVPLEQKMNSAIHQINHCPTEKLRYPLEGDLSGG